LTSIPRIPPPWPLPPLNMVFHKSKVKFQTSHAPRVRPIRAHANNRSTGSIDPPLGIIKRSNDHKNCPAQAQVIQNSAFNQMSWSWDLMHTLGYAKFLVNPFHSTPIPSKGASTCFTRNCSIKDPPTILDTYLIQASHSVRNKSRICLKIGSGQGNQDGVRYTRMTAAPQK